MPIYLRVPLATELLLSLLEAACPRLGLILPIGGSHIAQAGCLVLFGIVCKEYLEALGRRPPDDR